MILNTVVINKSNDHDTADVASYDFGLFNGDVLVASTNVAKADVQPNSGYPEQGIVDLTAWASTNPVPEGSYQLRVRAVGPEGTSPWSVAMDIELTQVGTPSIVSAS